MSVNYSFGREQFYTFEEGIRKEWLITNGIGGFASQSIIGANHRIQCGYLIASFQPPVDRYLIFSNTHEVLTMGEKQFDFTSQGYIEDYRKGYQNLSRFELDVIPTYTYEAEDVRIKKSIALEYGKNCVAICYECEGGLEDSYLSITPLFNYRPFCDTIEKSKLNFTLQKQELEEGGILTLVPKENPKLEIQFYASKGTLVDRSTYPTSMANPQYIIEENQFYRMDHETGFRGLDHHYTPYDVKVRIPKMEKVSFYLICQAQEAMKSDGNNNYAFEKDGFLIRETFVERMYELIKQSHPSDSFIQRLTWAADAFLVHRASTELTTVLAGYPWFTDWGRDTMIAFTGLTLCTKQFDKAREILKSFSYYVKDGMIPNVFPNQGGEEPGYNTIDASLWYFYAVDKYLEYTSEQEDKDFIKEHIYPALEEIIHAYETGTHYGIHMEKDGLITGGSDLDQLTWMDVRVGNIVVTPRHGKAVEINALWYNALRVMEKLSREYEDGKDKHYLQLSELVKESFVDNFWNEELGCLYDVIDTIIDEEQQLKGKDASIRPNQIYAVSLPYTMLEEEKERSIVQVVRKHLYTPYGLRTLSPYDPRYQKQYIGKLINRDLAYHMGTTWAYPMGAYITAYCKVNHYSQEAIQEANLICEYFKNHMNGGCINGIAEIFDGDCPSYSRGCYSQAWSVGEILRAYLEDVKR